MKRKTEILNLISEIEYALKFVKKNFESVMRSYEEYLKKREYAYLVEASFFFARMYGAVEYMFLNIASQFGNQIEKERWHKSLLSKMRLDVKGIRPKVIRQEVYEALMDIMGFRHFFRSAYDVSIDGERLGVLIHKWDRVKEMFYDDIERFLTFLYSLLEEGEDEICKGGEKDKRD